MYFKDILLVPFHPDEATQIFMSSDVDLIASGHIDDLFYNDFPEDIDKQRYRLLDAPFTRYVIGISRIIFKQPQLNKDWNWSLSWQQNQEALPVYSLLLISRLSVASLFPITLIIFYNLWKGLFNKKIALLGTILLLSNSVILLHTRRAMSESGLLFFLGLSLSAIFKLPKKYLFLSAIPIALGINCKLSLLPLIVIALIMFFYQFREADRKNILLPIAYFCLIFLSITYLLNPVMWKEPIKVGKIMVAQRSRLTQNQIEAIEAVAPQFILKNPNEKIVGLIAQTFVTKPAIQDIDNYHSELKLQIDKYLSNFLYTGYGRLLIPGFIYLILCLFGFITKIPGNQLVIIFKIAFMLFFIELLLFFSIPFQRYYLPLYPFVSIFASSGVFSIINKINWKAIIINKRI